MNPRMICLGGAEVGQTWSIRGETFSIGRQTENDLQIVELTVSRHHCILKRQGEQFSIRDLASRHGTFVNQLPIRHRQLEHHDLLTIGECHFLFLLDEVEGKAPDVADRAERELLAASTLETDPTGIPYPLAEATARPQPNRIARDLQALLELSRQIHGLKHSDQMAECLLTRVLHVSPAERGIVLLSEPESEELVTAAIRNPDSNRPFMPHRKTVQRALSQKLSILCRDIEQDQELCDSDNSQAATATSLLAIPLIGCEELLGVLYCDTCDPRNGFTEHHLDFLSAMAGIASLALNNVRHLEWLHRLRRLEAEPRKHDLVGESRSMQRVFKLISQVARVDTTVLIRGESGTGKELTARAIHQASSRASCPLLAINCATLSGELLESELFGHEKGAFTGAIARKIGKLEVAHGGTLFLDEVAEIPLQIQAKLLRVLQEREFDRVGGTRSIQVDVRLLAATNRDLEAAMREGLFREDLYYRLDVISLTLPPLRERREDIPLLASYFARRHAQRLHRRTAGFAPETRRALMAYAWPGNVRQLSNVIERALVLGEDGLIRPEDLPDEVLESGDPKPPSDFQATITETKKKLILGAFRDTGGDHRQAAHNLGLHVNSLHRLIRNLGLRSQLGK